MFGQWFHMVDFDDRPLRIESAGIESVPVEHRHGHARELFYLWFASNLGILNIVYGAVVASLGLNFWQAVAAIGTGLLTFVIVGILSLPGVRQGSTMMVSSSVVFGRRGNILPTLFSYLTVLGWETALMCVGTLLLTTLFQRLLGFGYLEAVSVSLPVSLAATFVWPIFGHATVSSFQKYASYTFGLLTVPVILFLWPHVDYAFLDSPGGAGPGAFVSAVTFIFSGTTLGWVNYASDYSRYLPLGGTSEKKVVLYH